MLRFEMLQPLKKGSLQPEGGLGIGTDFKSLSMRGVAQLVQLLNHEFWGERAPRSFWKLSLASERLVDLARQ